jgi:hypothetical protein
MCGSISLFARIPFATKLNYSFPHLFAREFVAKGVVLRDRVREAARMRLACRQAYRCHTMLEKPALFDKPGFSEKSSFWELEIYAETGFLTSEERKSRFFFS